MDEEYRIMLLYKRIFLIQLFERHTDRILYSYDLKYAPVRQLVKRTLIPPKIKIPKVKFVDINGTLIQQQEWDRRVELSRLIRDLTERGDIYG